MRHQVWEEPEFKSKLASCRKSILALWGEATELMVDAIMRYHAHSRDSSRIKRIWQMLEEAHQPTLLTVFQALLRKTTGLTKLGSPECDWTTDDRQFKRIENEWETTLESVEEVGLKAWDQQQRQERSDKAGGSRKAGAGGNGKGSAAATSLKVPDAIPEPQRNALQVALDRAGEAPEKVNQAIQAFQAVLKGEAPAAISLAGAFKNAKTQQRVSEFLNHCVMLANVEGTAPNPTSGKEETGDEKVFRIIENADHRILSSLTEDFGKKMEAVLEAAEAEAAAALAEYDEAANDARTGTDG